MIALRWSFCAFMPVRTCLSRYKGIYMKFRGDGVIEDVLYV